MKANDYLTGVENRAAAATDGPWEVLGRRVVLERGEDVILITPHLHVAEDAEFIASARNDVPRMTAALRAVLDLAEWHETKAEKARQFPGPGLNASVVMEKAAQVHDDAARRIHRAITEKLGVDE